MFLAPASLPWGSFWIALGSLGFLRSLHALNGLGQLFAPLGGKTKTNNQAFEVLKLSYAAFFKDVVIFPKKQKSTKTVWN